MPPRSYIEAMDRPTVLYIIYTMMSAQQTNLLPENASPNDAIFAQKVYRIYATTSQYLSSYGCAITMVYMYIYIYIYTNMKPYKNLNMKKIKKNIGAPKMHSPLNSVPTPYIACISHKQHIQRYLFRGIYI